MRFEEGGRVLRGIAVPYDSAGAVVMERGAIVRERFDESSLASLPEGVPLRVSHNKSWPPIGRIVEAENRSYGLAVGARLAISDAELDSWRARWAEDLAAGLSIGFMFSDYRVHEWVKPSRRGDLPTVFRRGVTIREVSVVDDPAYAGARIRDLAKRTAAGQRSHLESQEALRLAAESLAASRARKAQREASSA